MDKDIHDNKSPQKTYISKAFPQFKDTMNSENEIIQEFDGNIRIISKVVDSPDQFSFAKIKEELVIRRTGKGRQEIRATIFEESRGITVLSFQRYTLPSGKPHEASFSFIGDEISILYNFIESISTIPINSTSSTSIIDTDLNTFFNSRNNIKEFINLHQDILIELVSSEITKEDIIALGYRKKQLDVFYKLLNDSLYFEDLKGKYNVGNEGLWQKFFEKNNWIFGYGLNYIFNTPLNESKLEQIVSGSDFNSSGKRIDALLKTKGIIESFCFAEIKTHKTDLLKKVKAPYRPESWQVSDEITGALAQIQRTIQKAITTIATKTEIKDQQGNPTGEKVFLYAPKAFIVIGSLSEFETPYGINEEQYSSFEMFRQGLNRVEILTFDELYQRAKYIIRHSEEDIKL
jgi:hypothetical protein